MTAEQLVNEFMEKFNKRGLIFNPEELLTQSNTLTVNFTHSFVEEHLPDLLDTYSNGKQLLNILYSMHAIYDNEKLKFDVDDYMHKIKTILPDEEQSYLKEDIKYFANMVAGETIFINNDLDTLYINLQLSNAINKPTVNSVQDLIDLDDKVDDQYHATFTIDNRNRSQAVLIVGNEVLIGKNHEELASKYLNAPVIEDENTIKGVHSTDEKPVYYGHINNNIAFINTNNKSIAQLLLPYVNKVYYIEPVTFSQESFLQRTANVDYNLD